MHKTHRTITTVLGAGNMGTALAQVLAENGHRVHLWNWHDDLLPLQQIEKKRENKKYLPGVKLSHRIITEEKLEDALRGSSVVFFVIPAKTMKHTIAFASRNIEHNAVLVDVSKGVHPHTLQPITTIMSKYVRPKLKKNIVTMSGPAVAKQMSHHHHTVMNIASKNKQAIRFVRRVVENKYMHLIPTSDVIGVEVAGSFKNVYSIAMGICDGLGLGLNTKAYLITRSVDEIADLVQAMGGRRKTAYGLAGLGDLIGTGLAKESRNRQFGECLAGGLSTEKSCKRIGQTIEGISSSESLMKLSRKYKLDLPFAKVIFDIVHKKSGAKKAMLDFLSRVDF